MTNSLNHSEPAQMQADVISRRTTNESKLSVLVSEFRVVVLVGVLIAIIAPLTFSGAPAAVQIGAGVVVGAVLALLLRRLRLI